MSVKLFKLQTCAAFAHLHKNSGYKCQTHTDTEILEVCVCVCVCVFGSGYSYWQHAINNFLISWSAARKTFDIVFSYVAKVIFNTKRRNLFKPKTMQHYPLSPTPILIFSYIYTQVHMYMCVLCTVICEA